MKKPLLMLSLAVAAVSLHADVYQLFWDKSKPSGSFTDETMWKTVQGGATPDFDKGVDRFFRVEAKTGATNTVVLSDCNLRGGLNYYIWPTASLILDGRGTWFRQHSADESETVNNTVSYGPFTLRDSDYSMTAFNLKPANIATDSTISFSNSLQRFDRTASPNALKWTMESGYFSFAEPNAANAAHTLVLDCNSTDKIESRVTVEVAKDAEVVFPKVDFQCLSTNGELVVDGGKLDVLGEFKMDTAVAAAGWRNYVCTNYLTVRNGGRFRQLGGATTIGLNGNQGKRFENITVTGEGSCYEIASAAGNVTVSCSTVFNILDGGTFSTRKVMYMGGGYASGVNDNPRIRVSGVGTKYDGLYSALYLARKSEMIIEDGAEAILYHGLQIGYDVTDGSGEDNDSPSLTIRGDGTVVKIVSQNDGQAGVYVGNCTGTGTLNIEGGTLCGNTDANHIMMRIGAEYNSKGKGVVNMSGGKLQIGNGTYDQCVVGFRGNAEFNLSGGEVAAKCPLTFNYETTRATAPVTGLFNQTGGEATFKNADLCSLTVTEHRHSELRLDGGVFNTAYVTASKSKAAGGVGTATLTANGGTLKPTASRNTTSEPFVAKMDAFLLGPKGLTLDTGSYATLVKGVIGNKTGEQGLLVKKGSATLSLTGGAYDVALTHVEAGTLLLPDAEPDFSTALSVEQAGTFSLQGAATGVTLTGLTVNGGTLALDLGDVITVEGPVSLSVLRLSFSALPEVDSDGMDFLVVDGELDDASKRALRRAIVDNVATEGAHVDVTADYDSGAGKTTIKVLHRTDAPVITDLVTWTGSGSWSTAENWDPAKPTGEKKAVFGDEGSATEVDVDEAAVAGAISFARDGYTLSGEGSIEIAGAQGAAQIEVTAGRQTVDVPLTLDAVTEVAVAGGASLTLAKPLTDGGIVKTGSGTAILTATNDFFRPVSLSGGILELAGAATLGGAPRLDLAGNDTLVVSDEEPQRITVPVVANSTIGEPTILKADCDVTFDSIAVSGALIKRGAGTATLDATQSPVASVLSSVKTTQTDAAPVAHAVTYFPADGSAPPSADWCGFTVAEGEFVVKGSAETPAVKIQNFLVGMNATNMDAKAQAKLTIDGAKVDASAAHCYVGYGTSRQYSRQYTPTLAILNGAFLNVNALHIGTKTYGGTDRHPTFLMTNSTIYVGWGLDISLVESADANRAITAAKGSEILLANPLRLQGRFDADFDSCYIGGGNSAGARTAAPAKIHVDSYNQAQPGGTMRLRNGSILSAVFENFRYPTNPITFIWDDSEWRWANGLGNYTFTADSVNPDKTSFKMQGKGIILKPAEGATFTTEVPFVGAGGIQNLGAGTVKFAAGTAQFTGAAYAAEGATVDFTEAGAFTAALSGPGTFRLASQNGLKLALTATDDWTVTEVPTLDATALTGILTVDFGCDAEHPLLDTSPKGLVIAKLAPGTTYVPTALAKVRNTGLKSKRGVLTVNANGEIVMDVIDTGLMMIVR